MTSFNWCSPCDTDSNCNLDGAIAQLLQSHPSLATITNIHAAGAANTSRSKEDTSYPRILVSLGSPQVAEFCDEDHWTYDSSIQFAIYTRTPAEGTRLAGCVMQLLIEAGNIPFAYGVGCVTRPTLPQQRDLGKSVIETTFSLPTTIHQRLGNWCEDT